MSQDTETTLEPEADVIDEGEDREVSTPDHENDEGEADDADAGDEEVTDEGDQSDDDGEGDDDELEEVEWEGKTVRVPPEVKAALMRTADYTRKTQAVAEKGKALEAREAELTQQAELIEALGEERTQLALLDRQLKAMDGLDWDKLEEDDPQEAARLTRQMTRLKTQRDEVSKSVDAKKEELALKRQQDERGSYAKAIEDCQKVLSGKDGIKGWSPQLAEKLGEFATTRLGYTPQEVVRMTDPRMIKLVHQAYVGDQALRRERAKAKLEAGEKTAPVKRPGGSAPGAARKTTDSSGDGLSTAEWMRREQERVAARKR